MANPDFYLGEKAGKFIEAAFIGAAIVPTFAVVVLAKGAELIAKHFNTYTGPTNEE